MSERESMPYDVVIVGGGISGLATAFAVQEQAAAKGLSLQCTVLESDSSWGGKIVTHRIGDLVTEAGPDSFLSQKQAGLELCTKLGLTDQLINTNETGKKAVEHKRAWENSAFFGARDFSSASLP